MTSFPVCDRFNIPRLRITRASTIIHPAHCNPPSQPACSKHKAMISWFQAAWPLCNFWTASEPLTSSAVQILGLRK
ncbi:MAG: hypothetical protein Q9210_004992 [Variospora velana]